MTILSALLNWYAIGLFTCLGYVVGRERGIRVERRRWESNEKKAKE